MKQMILGIVMAGVSASVFAADENSVPCPEIKVGNSYLFVRTNFLLETESGFTITSKTGNTVEAVTNEGQEIKFDEMLNYVVAPDGRTFSPKYYVLPECPMKLGEVRRIPGKSKYRGTSGSDIESEVTIKVASSYGVTRVPAGEYKTVQVVATQNYDWSRPGASGSGQSSNTSYYAPELGIVVKTEFRDSYGDQWSKELKKVDLKK